MFKHKVVAVAAAATVALGLGATGASALTFPTQIGDNITGANTGGKIALGSIISCNSSLAGTITTDHGAGAGGAGVVTGGSFSSCTILTSATGNFTTPWTINITGPADANGNAPAVISGIKVTINAFGTCVYEGALTGTANEATGVLTLAGNLSRTTAGCAGGASEAVSGKYLLTDTTSNASHGQPRLLL